MSFINRKEDIMFTDCINLKYQEEAKDTLLKKIISTEAANLLIEANYDFEIKGVSLFKELVEEIAYRIITDFDGGNELLESIQCPLSQFYMDLSRNRHDIGIKSYHQFIKLGMNFNEEDITGLKAYDFALIILQNRGMEINDQVLVRRKKQENNY